MKYSQEAKRGFFIKLELYREALRSKENIVGASLAVHAALANVPKSYRSYVTKAYHSGGKA